jgi:hypothetical protein
MLAHSAPPPPPKLDRALSRSIASPSGRNFSPDMSRPARSISSAALPSLTWVSWPQPHQQVRRVFLFISSQPRRPRSHRSTHPPQLRRPHRREKERRRPQPFTPPGVDLHHLIPTERLRSRETASRPCALCPGTSVSTCAPNARSDRSTHPPRSLTPLARLSAPRPQIKSRPLFFDLTIEQTL